MVACLLKEIERSSTQGDREAWWPLCDRFQSTQDTNERVRTGSTVLAAFPNCRKEARVRAFVHLEQVISDGLAAASPLHFLCVVVYKDVLMLLVVVICG